jgi:hypothetical protein
MYCHTTSGLQAFQRTVPIEWSAVCLAIQLAVCFVIWWYLRSHLVQTYVLSYIEMYDFSGLGPLSFSVQKGPVAVSDVCQDIHLAICLATQRERQGRSRFVDPRPNKSVRRI